VTAAGTAITIKGTNFIVGSEGQMSVYLVGRGGSNDVTGAGTAGRCTLTATSVQSTSTLTCTAPAGLAAGSYEVFVNINQHPSTGTVFLAVGTPSIFACGQSNADASELTNVVLASQGACNLVTDAVTGVNAFVVSGAWNAQAASASTGTHGGSAVADGYWRVKGQAIRVAAFAGTGASALTAGGTVANKAVGSGYTILVFTNGADAAAIKTFWGGVGVSRDVRLQYSGFAGAALVPETPVITPATSLPSVGAPSIVACGTAKSDATNSNIALYDLSTSTCTIPVTFPAGVDDTVYSPAFVVEGVWVAQGPTATDGKVWGDTGSNYRVCIASSCSASGVPNHASTAVETMAASFLSPSAASTVSWTVTSVTIDVSNDAYTATHTLLVINVGSSVTAVADMFGGVGIDRDVRIGFAPTPTSAPAVSPDLPAGRKPTVGSLPDLLLLTTAGQTAVQLGTAPAVSCERGIGASDIYTAATLPAGASGVSLVLDGTGFTTGPVTVAAEVTAGSGTAPTVGTVTATINKLTIPLSGAALVSGTAYRFTVSVRGTFPAAIQLTLHVRYGACKNS
jgi:hypothetical protein